MTYKYLHAVGEATFWLDHRLTPEVSAMFCAMASRAPVGGIQARYAQVVEAVAGGLYDASRNEHPDESDLMWPTWSTVKDDVAYQAWYMQAEDRLCEYPLHPRVQKFFDDFVLRYGHSSIMELTGRPAVYSEGISWFTAWQLFDSPLCAGQEFSTRAVQHADWPMSRECYHKQYITGMFVGQPPEPGEKYGKPYAGHIPPLPDIVDPDLADLHRDWFEVFEAEVAWWKDHLSTEANRLALGIGDKEPFRPALDRARWALPGTIATGCAHTTPLRERARVLKDGSLLAQASGSPSTAAVWEELTAAYREALPGLSGMGLREAVYTPESNIPGHLASAFSDAPDGPDAEIDESYNGGLADSPSFRRSSGTSYIDPSANTVYRIGVTFRCSLAVARDWHRHRTLFPWHLQVVRDPRVTNPYDNTSAGGEISIDHHYEPKSDLAKQKLPELLRRSTDVFDAFMARGNVVQAALALPLGTRVRMRGQGGLRDVLYMLELRKNAVGANFEYKEQATLALESLVEKMGSYFIPVGPDVVTVSDRFGVDP